MAPAAVPADRLDKISQGQPGLWRSVLNRRNLAGVCGSLLFGPGLQLGKTGAVVGFCLVRWVYTKTEQYVPFTKRRHIVLLPSVAGECVPVCMRLRILRQQCGNSAKEPRVQVCMDSRSDCALGLTHYECMHVVSVSRPPSPVFPAMHFSPDHFPVTTPVTTQCLFVFLLLQCISPPPEQLP